MQIWVAEHVHHGVVLAVLHGLAGGQLVEGAVVAGQVAPKVVGAVRLGLGNPANREGNRK